MCEFDNMKDKKNTQLVIAHAFKGNGDSGLDYDDIELVLIERGIPIDKIRIRNAVRSLYSNGYITKRGSKYFASYKLNSMQKTALRRKAAARC